MIVEEITAMSILAVKNTPNSLKYMQKHINLWSQFQVIKVIKSSEMDIVSSRNVVGKHLKIIAGCGNLDECCGFPLPRGTQSSFQHEL